MMRVRRITYFAFALYVVLLTAACSSSPAAPAVSSLSITGSPPAVGEKSQYSAQAVLPNGTVENVTSSATWQTGNAAIATVSSAGVVTGVAAGTTSVTATYLGVTVTQQITI